MVAQTSSGEPSFARRVGDSGGTSNCRRRRRQVVTQALDAGHHVRADLRNAAKLDLTHPNLTVITGELTDRDAVQRAVGGADAMISALGPSLDRKTTGMPLVGGTR